MNAERSIGVFNTLISINNERIQGYQKASDETQEEDLKNFFNDLTMTSKNFKAQLLRKVESLGGIVKELKPTGNFYCLSDYQKAAAIEQDTTAILNSCDYGEAISKRHYEIALNRDIRILNAEQQSMIRQQVFLLNTDHNRLRTMRDSRA